MQVHSMLLLSLRWAKALNSSATICTQWNKLVNTPALDLVGDLHVHYPYMTIGSWMGSYDSA